MKTKLLFILVTCLFLLQACNKRDLGYGYGKKKGPIKKSADGRMDIN